jgi:riboflavin kinase / FMN adenylyltransferase
VVANRGASVSASVAHGLEDVTPEPSVVTIGNFDGVHRGHQLLLHRAAVAASDSGLRSVAVTFHPHPAAVLRPGREPDALTTLDDRVRLLADSGIDLVVILEFTRELSRLEPDEFAHTVLAEALGARRVVVGTNFRFGRGASGDPASLAVSGSAHGFEVEAVGLRALDGTAVSSSGIRDALARGDVAAATDALGRDHVVVGTVVAGDGRGRTIGVPTANLAVDPGLVVPAHGVYAGLATVDGESHPCVTNVGVRPTVTEGRIVAVEAHLLDVDTDLYGRRLAVSFAHRLRGEQRFESVDALVARIRADVELAREWLRTHRTPGADAAGSATAAGPTRADGLAEDSRP